MVIYANCSASLSSQINILSSINVNLLEKFYIRRYLISDMFNFARCELCEKKTSSIKYWFGSMTCPSCYDLQRSNPQTILVSNLQD